MTSRRLLRSPGATVLLLLALVLRVALPPGMMPGAGGSLIICSGMGPMPAMAPGAVTMHTAMAPAAMAMHAVTTAPRFTPGHAPSPAKPPSPCPFDAVAAPPLLPTPAPIPLRIASPIAPMMPQFATGTRPPPHRLRPPTRAPPTTLTPALPIVA